ncbi:hypothetical protein QM277_05485 [Acinetobacter baumannii]|uniref:hypothetical protein n=1 Tax=Acinetobacter baumannii TaxID=470 RepID=UPI0024B7821F|nr:hypothetical protein [Acinetobacter baumannii]MDI9702778.1 hypothetical protein [Acinetobacter baumannii]MDI9807556.1 hypothetical protein [Acinetobacter baumannii]
MTDLNKEREAFLNTFQYYKGRRDIIFSHEHELFMTRSNNPSEIAQKEISNMNSRWDAWLRCAKHRDAELEKAKAQAVQQSFEIGRLQDRITELLDERQDLYAQINNDQAVPEGYVLLPRVPTEKMFQAYERYSVAPMSTLSKNGYKAMVEASESGAEQ